MAGMRGRGTHPGGAVAGGGAGPSAGSPGTANPSALIEPAGAPFAPAKPSRAGAVLFSFVLAALVFCVVLGVAYLGLGVFSVVSLAVAFACALLAPLAMHVSMEWERIVIFRFGAFNRVAGPGLVFMLPIVEQTACRIDMRTIATPFGAERTLTSDLVPVDVDAVLFWVVWDAKKACVEVEDYCAAVLYTAQTTLRDAIGRMSVAEVALSRDQLDKELQDAIDRQTQDWGIAVLSVKVRDIVLPAELQDAMSLEAQAERERNARIVLAGAEEEIAEMIAAAGRAYEGNDAALRIRALHLLYESVKKSGGTVVTVPSTLSDGLGGASGAAGAPSAKDVARAVSELAGK